MVNLLVVPHATYDGALAANAQLYLVKTKFKINTLSFNNKQQKTKKYFNFTQASTLKQINAGRMILTKKTYKNFLCGCLLYTSPSPRDKRQSRMPSSA